METLLTWAPLVAKYVLMALGAAVAALAVIAPVTKTEADNRALAFVQKLLGYVESVVKVLLPSVLHPVATLPEETDA